MNSQYKYMVCTRCFTFNHGSYIEDTMRGFAMQETSFPVVNVIVDDASTDGEPEVIRRFLSGQFDKPFREEETEYASILCAQHKTNPHCQFVVILLKYNHFSIKKDKMKYLAEWLDNAKYQALCEGDDYWIDHYKLQKQVDLLERNADMGMVHTDCMEQNDDTRKSVHYINRINTQNSTFDTSQWNESINAIYDGRIVVRFCTTVMRTQLHKNIKKADPFLFDGHLLLGDTQLWVGIFLQKQRIGYIDEETTVYRVHAGSRSHATSYKNQLAFAISRYEIRLYYKREFPPHP